ncbi:MAG: dTDP-4-dehydrorhamnose reductase [Desulfovibrionales bacterium]|nr:dTDP-4-dehydrorhamnose reductase [Desulfovibrionales bacterium]
MDKKALILGGKSGLLGQALDHVLKKDKWETICPDRNDFDFLNKDQLREYILDLGVETVFNTIAYTQVDQAEDEKESALILNKKFPVALGDICRRQDIRLIHYSTDFVFNGKKTTPYTTEDDACPESIYGKTKLEGEKALMANKWDRLIIIRTSWLFGPFKTNFVDKIIGFAKEKNTLKIVHDQIGSPTYTIDLAKYSLNLFKKETSGLFHLANKGQASWCELASEAIKCAGLYCNTTPIPSEDYPQKAKRPPYSVLDCSKYSVVTGESPRPWIQSLREYIYNYQ